MLPHGNQHYQPQKDSPYDPLPRFYPGQPPMQSQPIPGQPMQSHLQPYSHFYSGPQSLLPQAHYYQPQYSQYDSMPSYLPSQPLHSPLPQLQQSLTQPLSQQLALPYSQDTQPTLAQPPLSQPLSHMAHMLNYQQQQQQQQQQYKQPHQIMPQMQQLGLPLLLLAQSLPTQHQQHQQQQQQPPQAQPASNIAERLQQLLPAPPLAQALVRPEPNPTQALQKRSKRKSKFTKAQDDLIVNLKKKGKLWAEIGELSGVGSYLAARNRYQVIVGQQGNNNSSSWNVEDKALLRRMLDAGELEKWRFIAAELNKATIKNFTPHECREISRQLFWADPASFGVMEDTIKEVLKEKRVTEKIIDQGHGGQILVIAPQSLVPPLLSGAPIQQDLPRSEAKSEADPARQQALPHLAPQLLPHIPANAQEMHDPSPRAPYMNNMAPNYAHQNMDASSQTSVLPSLQQTEHNEADNQSNQSAGPAQQMSGQYKNLY